MVECKNALVAENGDVEKAAEWLRKKGVAIAGKKSSREASQGLVAVKVSTSGDSAAIVEVDGCVLRVMCNFLKYLSTLCCAVQQ